MTTSLLTGVYGALTLAGFAEGLAFAWITARPYRRLQRSLCRTSARIGAAGVSALAFTMASFFAFLIGATLGA